MSSLIDHLQGLLVHFAPVAAKRMFGGYGLYVDELMFGLMLDETVYLKVDDGNRARFIERGLSPFEYEAKGKRISLSYYRAPEEFFDEPEVAIEWARSAFEAALRSRVDKSRAVKKAVAKKAVTKKVATKKAAKTAKVSAHKVAKQPAKKTAAKPAKKR